MSIFIQFSFSFHSIFIRFSFNFHSIFRFICWKIHLILSNEFYNFQSQFFLMKNCIHFSPFIVVVPFILATLYCTLNGYVQAKYLLCYADYGFSWALGLRFIIGSVLFLVGMGINLHGDATLASLREPKAVSKEEDLAADAGGGGRCLGEDRTLCIPRGQWTFSILIFRFPRSENSIDSINSLIKLIQSINQSIESIQLDHISFRDLNQILICFD